MKKARLQTGMIAYGLQGTLLGLALGVAGGMARRSVKGAVIGGTAGLVIGAAVSLAAAQVIVPLFWRKFNADPMADSVLLPILMRCGLWGPIGAAAGLALGIGLGGGSRALRTLVGGLLGGLAAAALYDFVIGVFILQFHHKTAQPLPGTWEARLVARTVAGLMIAAGAVLVSDLVMARKPKAKAPLA